MPRTGEAGRSDEELRERRLKSMRLRVAGYSYAEIAKETGMSATQAYKDVMWEIQRQNKEMKEAASDARNLELQRLDWLVKHLTPLVERNVEHAVDSYIKVMNRRAKLMGLDAATKQEIEVSDKRDQARKLTPAEMWQKMKELRERLEASGVAKRHPIQDERNPFLAIEERPVQEAQVIKSGEDEG